MIDTASLRAAGTSPAAIAHHYDLSDEFFALWLGSDLVYSCALWDAVHGESLADAQRRKTRLLRGPRSAYGVGACSTSAAAGGHC